PISPRSAVRESERGLTFGTALRRASGTARYDAASTRRLTALPGWVRDTGRVLRRVNWLARAAGYIWVGILAFGLFRADGVYALTALVVSYTVLGLGLIAWAVLDVRPELGG